MHASLSLLSQFVLQWLVVTKHFSDLSVAENHQFTGPAEMEVIVLGRIRREVDQTITSYLLPSNHPSPVTLFWIH